jgi:hypothetical protein
MATTHDNPEPKTRAQFAPAPEEPRNHALTAALIGGAAAAAAGAVWGAKALAKRGANGNGEGRSLNAFMQTAVTASEVADRRSEAEPLALTEPSAPREPPVPAP